MRWSGLIALDLQLPAGVVGDDGMEVAVSELVLAGLEAESEASRTPSRRGLTLLPAAEGHVVTAEMVAEALDDD